jgi:hypothetical protein
MSTLEAVMTTQEVANRMNELFKQFKWDQVQEELFADDAESIEPAHSPGLKSVKGKDAIKKKGADFNAIVEEFHGGWVGDPVVGAIILLLQWVSMQLIREWEDRTWKRSLCMK